MSLKRPTGEALAKALAVTTGYVFRDFSLMSRALTHSSVQGKDVENNERLEFLGDRVLGLVVSDMLYAAYPDADQGELSIRLNALVNRDVCAEISEEIGLVGLMRAESAVKAQAGKQGKNVRADVAEALIAAIYLDGGLDEARKFILRFWEQRSRAPSQMLRDAKTDLQQWVQGRGGTPPLYVIESREGPDHDLIFTVRVELPGHQPAKGTGRSKQAAQQAAAAEFMIREGIRSE
jgi:ribonuclease-3